MGFQETFKAISDPTRRSILELLKEGRRTAGDIASKYKMTQATVSFHLNTLKLAGLISDVREGKYIYYELNMSVVEEMLEWFVKLKTNKKGE